MTSYKDNSAEVLKSGQFPEAFKHRIKDLSAAAKIVEEWQQQVRSEAERLAPQPRITLHHDVKIEPSRPESSEGAGVVNLDAAARARQLMAEAYGEAA